MLAKREPWQNTVKTMSIKMTVSSDGHDDGTGIGGSMGVPLPMLAQNQMAVVEAERRTGETICAEL